MSGEIQTADKLMMQKNQSIVKENRSTVVFREQNGRPGNVKAQGDYNHGTNSTAKFEDKSQPRPNRNRGRRAQPSRNISSSIEWSRVTINYGKKYSKCFILNILTNYLKVPFIPTSYHAEGENAVFYVEGNAGALQSLSGQIEFPEGHKINLSVRRGRPPIAPFGEKLYEKLKLVISKRYDKASKTLDLSKFYSDKELCIEYYAPLNCENIFYIVNKIIAENIPDVNSINLSSNRLRCVNQLKTLKDKATELNTLNLNDNNICSINLLDGLEGFPIKHLSLKRNSLSETFINQKEFVSALRKRLPLLISLNGVDLPPSSASRKIEADNKVPPPQPSGFFALADVRTVVSQYLELYISVYDNDNRSYLLDAYDDAAVLTLTLYHRSAEVSSRPDRCPTQKFRFVQNGKNDIISLLSILPKTTHDRSRAILDIPFVTSALIIVSLTGIFKETSEQNNETRRKSKNQKSKPKEALRWFQRVFALIPNKNNNGFSIVNEKFYITNPSAKPAENPCQVVAPPAAHENKEASQEELQTRMVRSFSEQSGMSLEWSAKCLKENSWDFDRAANDFCQVKSQIPPEAFTENAHLETH